MRCCLCFCPDFAPIETAEARREIDRSEAFTPTAPTGSDYASATYA